MALRNQNNFGTFSDTSGTLLPPNEDSKNGLAKYVKHQMDKSHQFVTY